MSLPGPTFQTHQSYTLRRLQSVLSRRWRVGQREPVVVCRDSWCRHRARHVPAQYPANCGLPIHRRTARRAVNAIASLCFGRSRRGWNSLISHWSIRSCLHQTGAPGHCGIRVPISVLPIARYIDPRLASPERSAHGREISGAHRRTSALGRGLHEGNRRRGRIDAPVIDRIKHCFGRPAPLRRSSRRRRKRDRSHERRRAVLRHPPRCPCLLP